MAGKYGTPYLESEAILALGANDEDHARSVLAGMTPNERHALADAAHGLVFIVREFDRGPRLSAIEIVKGLTS